MIVSLSQARETGRDRRREDLSMGVAVESGGSCVGPKQGLPWLAEVEDKVDCMEATVASEPPRGRPRHLDFGDVTGLAILVTCGEDIDCTSKEPG